MYSYIHIYECIINTIVHVLYSDLSFEKGHLTQNNLGEMFITLAAKRRRKGMVIILCVCVSVCLFAKIWENYKH